MRSVFLVCIVLAACASRQDDEPEATAGTGAGASALADGLAGAVCTSDADCGSGRCVPSAMGRKYCTATCNTNRQCGEGGLCVAALPGSGSTSGSCLAACTEQDECRDGFVCALAARTNVLAVLGGCRPKDAVGALQDQHAGRACEGDAQCPGGQCQTQSLLGPPYPGGYCSARCYEDASCGQGGVCLWLSRHIDAGHCLAGCATDADCTREGYRCRQLGDGKRVFSACVPGDAPLPDYAAGSACETDADCAAPARCALELSRILFADPASYPALGGYCTHGCALDSDCGLGAQCVNDGMRGGICLASCSDDAPCREGYECIAHLRDGDPEAKVCWVALPKPDDENDAGE